LICADCETEVDLGRHSLIRTEHVQRFLSVQGLVRNLFCVGRHLLQAAHHRLLRTRSFLVWNDVTGYLLKNNGSPTSKGSSGPILVNVTVPSRYNRRTRSTVPSGTRLGLGRPSRPMEQPVIAELLVPLLPAVHLPRKDPENVRRLKPVNLPADRSQNHFLNLHRPLHRGTRILPHLASQAVPYPPLDRTF
jgi:hypothetical protein